MEDFRVDDRTRLFCPRCHRAVEPGAQVCSRCFGVLQAAGYCPICEDWALATPGKPCPKHDVELADRPIAADVEGSDSRLVTVATFGIPSEAQGPRLRLEAEGIPAFLQGQRMGAIYQVATGGVTLQVPEEFAGEARIILAQTWSPPKDTGEDPDDPWEGLGPDPAERRRSVMKLAILVLLFGPVVFSLIGVVLASLRRP